LFFKIFLQFHYNQNRYEASRCFAAIFILKTEKAKTVKAFAFKGNDIKNLFSRPGICGGSFSCGQA